MIYYIVGNKCDLDEDDEREVPYEEGYQWVEEYKEEEDDDIDIKFIEVSAKNGININILFEEISVKLLDKHEKMAAAAGGSGKKVGDKY